MKKIIAAVLVCTLTLFVFSCKNAGGGDPKLVLSEFFDALAKKDLSKARTLATAESKQMLDLMEMGLKAEKNEDLAKYDRSKMEFGESKIDGDKATVAVKELSSGETVNYPLKKEGGAWKVAFDKSSLMTIGMDKMNEKGINPLDSMSKGIEEVQKGLDEMKNVNIDSLSKELKKINVDSIAQELKKLQK